MAAHIPPVKKRKLKNGHSYLDLDDPKVQGAFRFPADTLDTLPECARPAFELVVKALSTKYVRDAEKVYQAGTLSVSCAVDMLGIDYDQENAAYNWALTSDEVKQAENVNLSSWAQNTLDMIKKSRYYTRYHPESLTRTIIDILLCDRLDFLDDNESNHHLHVASEVNIDAPIQNESAYGWGRVSGRADWTLGYGAYKAELGTVLAVVEAKRGGYASSAISQLLAYLAGVQDARKDAGKINYDIFGIATDSNVFEFVVLCHNRCAYVSEPLRWSMRRSTIIAFIDHILRKAIESSPHTTPVKKANKHIMKYDKYLRDTFTFGSSEESDISHDEDDGQSYDVIVVEPESILKKAS